MDLVSQSRLFLAETLRHDRDLFCFILQNKQDRASGKVQIGICPESLSRGARFLSENPVEADIVRILAKRKASI
jgi:hypothetical protein